MAMESEVASRGWKLIEEAGSKRSRAGPTSELIRSKVCGLVGDASAYVFAEKILQDCGKN